MEITESTIYWITRLDGVKDFLGILIGFFSIMTMVFFIFGLVNWFDGLNDDDKRKGKKLCKLSILPILASLIFGLGIVFIPSTKEMCAIKVIPVIASNEEVQELPNKIVELANEWVEELSPKAEKEK